MPSIASHFVCAKLVSKELGIKDDDFYKGNILPDIINNNNSHYKRYKEYCLVPNIECFLNDNKYNNMIFIGYLCHLLLDKYFLEEYIPLYIDNYNKIDNLFSIDKIYKDYVNLNKILVDYFELDLEYINVIMKNLDCDLNEDKYKLNLDSINYLDTSGELDYIYLDNYILFLKQISIRISIDIKGLLDSEAYNERVS